MSIDPNNLEHALSQMHVPNLTPNLAGKFDFKGARAKTQREIDMETAVDKAQAAAERTAIALAKAIAQAEGEFAHDALKRIIPRTLFYRAEKDLDRGDSVTMKRLLSEYEIQITQVQHPELEAEDQANGITRRHLRISKGGEMVKEHIWEWSRA